MVALIMIRDPTFPGSVEPYSPAPEKSQFKELRFWGEKSANLVKKVGNTKELVKNNQNYFKKMENHIGQ